MAKQFTPKLSPRLEGIVSLVPRGSKVADIGCDHGYISIALVQRGIAISSIASDIKEGPLLQAKKNIEKASLQEKIETRLSPGIMSINKGEAEVIIIAGMGQRTIADILTEKMDIAKEAKYLILQPQSELSQMRQFLKQNGFNIIQNKMMREGEKYYFAMVASFSEKTVPGDEINCLANLWKSLEEKNLQPEIKNIYEQLDDLIGLDLIYTDCELGYFLNHVDHEWSEALDKLGHAKKPDFDKIEDIKQKLNAVRLALEINMQFCKISPELMDLVGNGS